MLQQPAVQVQFAGMLDAIRFFTSGPTEPVLKGCEFTWASDPCANATGPHSAARVRH
jgi:hypothetical protein